MRIRVPKIDWSQAEAIDEGAVHEACHAVVAWAIGARVCLITIRPGRQDGIEYGGRTRTVQEAGNGVEEACLDFSAISVAPILLFAFGRRIAGQTHRVSGVRLMSYAYGNRCAADWDGAYDRIVNTYARPHLPRMDESLNRASTIIERYWEQITRLARTLQDAKELEGDQILDVLNAARRKTA
jgi:hypothetical protein